MKEKIVEMLRNEIDKFAKELWQEPEFQKYFKNEMEEKLEEIVAKIDDFIGSLNYYYEYYSKDRQYSFVLPRKGGPYSLFCYTCRRWIPNESNFEMAKEGYYSHSHFCERLGDTIQIYSQFGIPEGENDD